MNTSSSIEIRSPITRALRRLFQIEATQRIDRALLTNLTAHIASTNQHSTMGSATFKPGERVIHGGFGKGRIVACSPDGRVLVRFDNTSKNRAIFPSFLNKANRP